MSKDIKEIKGDEGDGIYVGLCPSCDLIHMGFERDNFRFEARITDSEAVELKDALDVILRRRSERLKQGSVN